MVGGDAVTHQPERRRQAVEEIDRDVQTGLGKERGRGVHPGRPGADDGDAQRMLGGSYGAAHGAVDEEASTRSGGTAPTRRRGSARPLER